MTLSSAILYLKKTQICLSLWLIRLPSMVKCDFQMKMKMNSLEELYHHFPLQLLFSLLIVLKYFYFSSPCFLLNLPYIIPVKLLSLMRLTTSELTNLVGEFLELTYTWPLSSRRLSCIWKLSSPHLMLYNTFPITSQCGRRFSIPFISSPLAKQLILEFFLSCFRLLTFYFHLRWFHLLSFIIYMQYILQLSSTCIKFWFTSPALPSLLNSITIQSIAQQIFLLWCLTQISQIKHIQN